MFVFVFDFLMQRCTFNLSSWFGLKKLHMSTEKLRLHVSLEWIMFFTERFSTLFSETHRNPPITLISAFYKLKMGSGISKGTSEGTGTDPKKQTYWLSAQVRSFLCYHLFRDEETHHLYVLSNHDPTLSCWLYCFFLSCHLPTFCTHADTHL